MGNVELVADLTRFLMMVASPELTNTERDALKMPSINIGRDTSGKQRAQALEGCLLTTENILRLLRGRGIYAAAPVPDGGELGENTEQEVTP